MGTVAAEGIGRRLRSTAPKGTHPAFPSPVPWFPVAGPLSYTKSAIFVYEPGLIGLSYTVEAIFVYESMLFGLSYTKKAIFVHGNREAPPLSYKYF